MKGRLKSQMMNLTLKDADYNKKSKFEQNFAFKKRLTDPRFGEISIIQNPQTRQLLAVRERKINDKKTAGAEIVNCKNRLTHKHPNLLNLLDYSVTKQSELCSSFYVIKEFFEYPRSDLAREIQMKEKEGETMDHKDLTHILYQQIAVNSYLQNKDMSHGDIQPINITWDRNTKNSKLIDKSRDLMDSNRALQIQKNRFVSGHKLYQSPKMYSNIKKGNLKFDNNGNKEDTYALGLCLLEAGNGKSIQNIYNKAKGEVDQQKLQEHLGEFENRYSQQNTLLCSTVASMVAPEETDRPDFKALESQIPNYEEVKNFLDNDNQPQGNYPHQNMNNNQNNYNDVPYNYDNKHPGYNLQNQNQNQNFDDDNENNYWNVDETKNAYQQNNINTHSGINQEEMFQPKGFNQVQTPNVHSMPRQSLNNSTYSNQNNYMNQNYDQMDENPFAKKGNKIIVNASNDNTPPVPQQNNQQIPQQNVQPIPQKNVQPIPQQNIQPIPQQNIQPIPQQNTQPIPQQNQNTNYDDSIYQNQYITPNYQNDHVYNQDSQLNTTHNTTNSKVYYDSAKNYPKLQYAPQPEYKQTYVSLNQGNSFSTGVSHSDRHVTYQTHQPTYQEHAPQRITQTYTSPYKTTQHQTYGETRYVTENKPYQENYTSSQVHLPPTYSSERVVEYRRPSQQIIQGGQNSIDRRTTTTYQNYQPQNPTYEKRYDESKNPTYVKQYDEVKNTQHVVSHQTYMNSSPRYNQDVHVSHQTEVQPGLKLLRTYEDPSKAYKRN